MIKLKYPLLNFIAHAYDFMARQESFNPYVGRELKNNAFEIGRVGDNLARVKNELLKLRSSPKSIPTSVTPGFALK